MFYKVITSLVPILFTCVSVLYIVIGDLFEGAVALSLATIYAKFNKVDKEIDKIGRS